MTPEQYTHIRTETKEAIDTLETMLSSAYEMAQSYFPGDLELRPAKPGDISAGQIVYYKDGDKGPFWVSVQYVINPNCPFKAFSDEETGSRYGLDGAFVRKDVVGMLSNG